MNRRVLTATYEERVVEKGEPLKMYLPPSSKIHILTAMPMGPDVLYKFVVVHDVVIQELDYAK